jgi:hypothetical protein
MSFLRWVSRTICLGLPLNHDPPDLCLLSSPAVAFSFLKKKKRNYFEPQQLCDSDGIVELEGKWQILEMVFVVMHQLNKSVSSAPSQHGAAYQPFLLASWPIPSSLER